MSCSSQPPCTGFPDRLCPEAGTTSHGQTPGWKEPALSTGVRKADGVRRTDSVRRMDGVMARTGLGMMGQTGLKIMG